MRTAATATSSSGTASRSASRRSRPSRASTTSARARSTASSGRSTPRGSPRGGGVGAAGDRGNHLRTRAELQAFRPYGDDGEVRRRTEEALEDGRLDDAEALLRDVERQAAENVEAARRAAEDAIRAKAQATALRGNLRLMQLDYAGAAAAFGEALAALPEGDAAAADYLTRLARAERGAGRFDRAAEAAAAALATGELRDAEPAARAWRECARPAGSRSIRSR